MKTSNILTPGALLTASFLIAANLQGATILELSPTVWFNAGSITGVANEAPVAAWPDSSGNGRNATQATASRQPLYIANGGAHGMPVLRFNTQLHSGGTVANQFLSFAAPLANNATSVLTLFAVASDSGVRTSGARAIVVNTRTSGSLANGFLFGYGTTPSIEGYAHTGSTSPAGGVQTTPIAASGFDLLAFERNGLASTVFNYSDTATNSTSTTWTGFNPSTLTTTQIGTEGGAHYFFGDVAEVIAFERILTASESDQVVKYLGDKYLIATASAVPEPSVVAFLVGGALLFGSRHRPRG